MDAFLSGFGFLAVACKTVDRPVSLLVSVITTLRYHQRSGIGKLKHIQNSDIL